MNLDLGLLDIALQVTEKAAIACYDYIGSGKKNEADAAAVNAMRLALNEADINGVVVIGEGERDEAPMLYIGEKVGSGRHEIDIALDPLEGTNLCANGSSGSMTVLAFANKNSILHAPDVYMEKIATGICLPEGELDLDNTIHKNLSNLSKAKKVDIGDLSVIVLNRPRHEEMIAKIRELGSRVILIEDGDVAAVISTATPKTKIDLYIGSGGAPEGVLAASSLKTVSGFMMGRLLFKDDTQKERAKKMGISDLNKKYLIDDMIKGETIFCASGVTDGSIVKGVKRHTNELSVSSVVMHSGLGLVRKSKTTWLKSIA